MLLDRMADPVVAVDQNGRLVHYNLLAGRLLGIASDRKRDCPGQVARQIDCRVEGLGFLERVLATEEGFDEREMFLDFGGGEKPYLVSAEVLKSEGGIHGAMAVIRPLGELHRWAYDLTHAVGTFGLDEIIGQSRAIQSLKEKAFKVATSKSTVLVLGESGTGKELLARGIHYASSRADKPFVVVNCAAIPDTLLESELFGYEEGAFTGARKRGKPGKFELADGGTLFLDEIGDMPLHLQGKLLRVLQGREVERLGGTRLRPVDVRVIAATNQDLEEKIAGKKFREDLYFRLNVIPLRVPPLRERDGDVLLLARHFVEKHAHLLKKDLRSLAPEVCRLLESYHWPGNVRELENTIEYAANLETTAIIQTQSLPEAILYGGPGLSKQPDACTSLADMEAQLIRDVMRRYGWSHRGKQAAARELGIGIATLYRKLASYRITQAEASKR